MDRAGIAAAFDAYVRGYDAENPMIRLKIEHTWRVAAISERIAGSLSASTDLAWLLGVLHDIGRFEQARRYGTFLDGRSVNHAEFGADLLFREGLIDRFPADGLLENWREAAETAIRLHNRLALPEDLDPATRTLSQVLRDADKVDIFRVSTEFSQTDRIGAGAALEASDVLSPGVLDCVMGHRCVPRGVRRNALDIQASHACMAFELVYPESRDIARAQGWLVRLLSPAAGDSAARREQLALVRREIEAAWGMPLAGESC